MSLRTLDQLDVRNRRVVVRVDFNVPVKDGRVSDDSRIRATLPTLDHLIREQSTMVLMSHLGRPKGAPEDRYRLGPVAAALSEALGLEVRYLACDGPASSEQQSFVAAAPEHSLTLLENTRFDTRETKNDVTLAKVLAGYGERYVNDAFGAAHRAHASTEAIARLLPGAAGRLLEREVQVLTRLVESPEHPYKVILGGAKVSDKIGVIENLLSRADAILIGGAMAYTFIKARGGNVGNSRVEDDKLELARDLEARAQARGVALMLPEDSLCATEIAPGVETRVFPSDRIPDGWMGLDVGPKAAAAYRSALADARTVLWNGPLGVFETPPFDRSTSEVARAVAELDAFTVIGGGDSVAAVNAAGVSGSISHISTGGGASLEFLEGRSLPGLAVLQA